MLHSHSDHQATLITRSQAAGLFTAEGRIRRIRLPGLRRRNSDMTEWAKWIWDGTELLVEMTDSVVLMTCTHRTAGATSAVTLIGGCRSDTQ